MPLNQVVGVVVDEVRPNGQVLLEPGKGLMSELRAEGGPIDVVVRVGLRVVLRPVEGEAAAGAVKAGRGRIFQGGATGVVDARPHDGGGDRLECLGAVERRAERAEAQVNLELIVRRTVAEIRAGIVFVLGVVADIPFLAIKIRGEQIGDSIPATTDTASQAHRTAGREDRGVAF